MARSALIIVWLTVACVAVSEGRKLRQVVPSGFQGGQKWWKRSGRQQSSWSHGQGCYKPVTSDRSWTYYRMAVSLTPEAFDNFMPSNTSFVLRTTAIYFKVFDLPSGTDIGVAQATVVITSVEDHPTTPTPADVLATGISNLVLELGPDGDDSLIIAGATTNTFPTPSVHDTDNAITGGVGKYLGATGEFLRKDLIANGPNDPKTTLEAELNIWVPKLKSF